MGASDSRSSVSPTSSSSSAAKNNNGNNVGGVSGGSVFPRDTSSTFSHDSGVDSMNTNSSGSVLSRQTPVSYSSAKTSQDYCGTNLSNKTPTKGRSRIPTLVRQKPVKSSSPAGAARMAQQLKQDPARHVSLV